MKRAVGSGQSETVVCKSKFLAENFLIDNPAQVKEIIRRQKERYPDATHVCHAFLCGPRREFAGCSDDHEPSGTAGRPMLEVLKGSGLTDILVTVVRWFGGTKLGTGGLVRAYSDAVKELLTHIPFHVGTHHMALITYVVFAEALDDIHGQETDRDPGQCTEDRSAVPGKERVCHRAQDLRICEIYDTDKSRAD